MATGMAEDLIAEVTDFLADSPPAEQIIAYKVSEKIDQRLHELLDLNAAGVLTADQQTELDEFVFMNHFLILLKTKARANYRPPLNFPVVDLGPWPEGFEVRREEIYGDDGR